MFLTAPGENSPGVFLKDSLMKLQKLLLNCFLRWKEISGHDFCLLNLQNQVFVTTDAPPSVQEEILEAFRESGKPSEETEECLIFRVREEGETIYLLLVWEKDTQARVTGELMVCQVETLISSGSRNNDRSVIIQDILMGRFGAAEILNQAKKIHLSQKARRVVFLIETKIGLDDAALQTIRNIFVSRNRDFIAALDESTCVVIHEMKDSEDTDDIDSISGLLVDILNTEVMTRARVACSNICEEVQQLPHAYQEAMIALQIGRIFYAERSTHRYAKLGIGRLLYQIPVDICMMFLDEILGDQSINSLDEETLNIIRTFFENNLNLSETSRQLYVHRNTLVYRLEKLEKKYGLDIRTFEDALTFKLAMLVTEYVNSEK